ncbi:MAG: mechanosensitive ion channel [Betaproteobacteria bacterium]|nr:mechanosensitive ion channel [Betaproteobacteria bacterium]
MARAAQTKNIFDDVLAEALLGPSRTLVWIVGLAFATQIVGERTDAAILRAVGSVRDIGIIAMVMWFALRFVKLYEAAYIRHREAAGEVVDKTFVTAIGKLLRAAVVITAALVMLQTMGINIAGLLAFGGVGGIAVGLAARDIMANLFGGLTVYLDRPFAVGDWIRSPDREIEGTVEDIGWRRTVIRTFDLRPLYVPNAAFTTITVENPSRMLNRRIKETIGVRYDDAARIPAILNDVRKFLLESPDIDQSRTLMVNFDEFGASSMNFFIYAFTRTRVWTEFHMVKEQVMLRISDIIASHGAEIAFPTTTLHVPDGVHVSGDLPSGGAQAPAKDG